MGAVAPVPGDADWWKWRGQVEEHDRDSDRRAGTVEARLDRLSDDVEALGRDVAHLSGKVAAAAAAASIAGSGLIALASHFLR